MNSNDSFKRVGENLFMRQGRYYGLLKRGRKQIKRSLRTQDRNIARARLEALRTDVNAAVINPEKRHIPIFTDAVKQTIEMCKGDGMKERCLESVEGHLNQAKDSFLGAMKVSIIRKEQIRDYLRGRFSKTSGRTANLDLIQLRKVFKLAIERGWRWDNPTIGIPQFHHKEREVPVPSLEDVRSVVKVLREMPIRGGAACANFIELLFLSGLRFSEAQNLRWKDVDLARNVMTVIGKGDKERQVDLFPSLLEFLTTRMTRGKSEDFVFPARVGEGYDPRNALAIACKKAEVRPFSFHGLRHRWATTCVENGLDFGTIADWMGHADGGWLVAKRYGKHRRREHFVAMAPRVLIRLDSTVANCTNACTHPDPAV